jgi:hypothetical protein
MHQGTRIVFDEMLNAEGGLTLYTSLLHTDFLSEAHQLGLQAILSTSAMGGYCIISVQIQHSTDGRNWLNKNTSPELTGGVSLTPGVSENSVIGGESWPPRPRLRFVMLAISVTTRGVSPPASRLQVVATARTRTRAAPEPEVAPLRVAPMDRRAAMASVLGMRSSTLQEVEEHMRNAPPGAHLAQLADRLSSAAREDLRRVIKIFRGLDPEQRRAALTFAHALRGLAMLPPEQPQITEPSTLS